MRRHGINYDTGFTPIGEEISRQDFDPGVVRREMRIIADELHCDAVRVSGGDPDRLSTAAEAAAAAGLEVWFAPFPCGLRPDALHDVLLDCADRAEAVRRTGAETVYVTGCEITLFNHGFFAGATLFERMAVLKGAAGGDRRALYTEAMEKLGGFLRETAEAVRPRFGGRLSYASGPWERIDWTPFDIVGVDAYRAAHNEQHFREEVRGHLAHGKPVVATEFGCCTYRGAGLRGGTGWTIVDEQAQPPALDGEYTRDEGEQVRYFDELLTVFEEEGFDAAFWFSFAGYGAPHRPDDPRHDLDMAAYGVVKMLDAPVLGGSAARGTAPGGSAAGAPDSPYAGLGWEPKEVFHAMAARYGRSVT
ncbi:hypothetical protein OHB13_25865 [Streptomyces sp. NBC_00440]|uniref:hypothetical protein n=1 Tax=Streptomyces sp. NBC_00440 TaxID=2975741 RepID=UPI002E201E39